MFLSLQQFSLYSCTCRTIFVKLVSTDAYTTGEEYMCTGWKRGRTTKISVNWKNGRKWERWKRVLKTQLQMSSLLTLIRVCTYLVLLKRTCLKLLETYFFNVKLEIDNIFQFRVFWNEWKNTEIKVTIMQNDHMS